MTDANIRNLERTAASGDLSAQAALMIKQIRSGTLPRLSLRETKCRGKRTCMGCHDSRNGRNCSKCGGSGVLQDKKRHMWEEGEWMCKGAAHRPKDLWRGALCGICIDGTLPYDPKNTVNLLAYWGCEASRLVIGDIPYDAGNAVFNLEYFDASESGVWVPHLLEFAAKLPPLQLVGGVECPEQPAYLAKTGHPPLCNCSGTGRKPYLILFEHWIAVKIGAAVGKACAPYTKTARDRIAVARALNAAEAWVRCPCPRNAEACRNAETAVATWAHGATSLAWNPFTTVSQIEIGLRGASELIGENAVRKAIQKVRP